MAADGVCVFHLAGSTRTRKLTALLKSFRKLSKSCVSCRALANRSLRKPLPRQGTASDWRICDFAFRKRDACATFCVWKHHVILPLRVTSTQQRGCVGAISTAIRSNSLETGSRQLL